MILTHQSLAEAAPNLNNVDQTEPTVVIEQVQTDPAPVEPTKVEPVVEPVPTPVEAPVVAKVVQPKPKPVITGDKYTWMTQAGIPESEWEFVDYIVSRESSWNPLAVNKSSGACGLVQSLPCSKLGANWSDPVVALKWQHKYVIARYGGYAQAVEFWRQNSWY